MKNINIFLASSAELEDDRNAFGNLVRRLNKTYERRGLHIELFEWEDYDASYNGRRKQDEYNEQIRICDMFIAVFHRVAGKFTKEEFNIATDEHNRRKLPKIYVYCKTLSNDDTETQELKDFKRYLLDELGHYFSNYTNRDTMQLHFVMQLQQVEVVMCDELKVEDGFVTLDGERIARMENLPFASQNDDFQRISKHLSQLGEKIEKIQSKIEEYPEDEDFKDELQRLLNEYNSEKEAFAEFQKSILNTAKRVAQLQGAIVTNRLRRAMDAFYNGKVREANIILDEAERDGMLALERYRATMELAEQERQSVINSIEEILFKASTTMADLSIDINERIAKVNALYDQADAMAAEVAYDGERYADLLNKYSDFLCTYAIYDKALTICNRHIALCEELYDAEHPYRAIPYNNIGIVYEKLGEYRKSVEYHLKALEIQEKTIGVEHPNTAASYNNIGLAYSYLSEYDRALEYLVRALRIYEKTLGNIHPNTANIYNNIGIIYDTIGQYETSERCHLNAIAIRERALGVEHPDTAMSYSNIGIVYDTIGQYNKALEYHLKALDIYITNMGEGHPHTATAYNNIGNVYNNCGQYDKALHYYLKALEIRIKIFDDCSLNVASSYDNIGLIYNYKGEYERALEYHHKAIAIYKQLLNTDDPNIALSYNNIGYVYANLKRHDIALEYFIKSLEIRERLFGPQHPDTAQSYNNVGGAYGGMGKLEKALDYLNKALEVWRVAYGEEHNYTKITIENIERIKSAMEQ